MNQKFLWPLALAIATLLSGCGSSKPAAQAPAAADPAGSHTAGAEPAADGDGSEHVELTDAQVQASGIGLAEAGPAEIREILPVYGVIAPNAERVRDVAARFPGAIRSLSKAIGDPARQGETLATVESNESLQTYPVIAPLSGVVIARHANPGEQTGDQPLFTIADLSTVWVQLSLFPRDMTKVHLGQTVKVHSGDTGLTGEGRIVYVAPFGTSANQTLTARVLLDNAAKRWAPGLYVTADITLAADQVGLAVRNEALQTMTEGNTVFVRCEQGFEPRNVSIGRTDGRFAEVTGGLRPGEIYVAANSFILKAEFGKGEAEHGH